MKPCKTTLTYLNVSCLITVVNSNIERSDLSGREVSITYGNESPDNDSDRLLYTIQWDDHPEVGPADSILICIGQEFLEYTKDGLFIPPCQPDNPKSFWHAYFTKFGWPWQI